MLKIIGNRSVLLVFFLVCFIDVLHAQSSGTVKTSDQFINPSNIAVKGLLGESIKLAEKGRLRALPSWNNGQLIKMFSVEERKKNTTTDWYGEHGGKWLYTAAIAAQRTGDDSLQALLFKTADYLVSTQEADGYLGSYSPALRITNNESKLHKRSWDTWALSCMIMGLLEVDHYFPETRYRTAATKIGELLLKTFGDGINDITNYGTRYGYSATVALEPVVELYKATGDKRYLDFAQLIVKEVEKREGLRLIASMLNDKDVETVADGKAYQIIWNVTGLAKLYEITGTPDYLKAVEKAWQNIKDYHLTITGGPWGGVGKHKECFNVKGYWDPYGFIETCSTMSWIQLNKQLLHLTGEAKYAQEIERSAYNALLGAQFSNGIDWSYHTFTNGKTHVANFTDCCPSSGVMALEELSPLVYSKRGAGIALNMFTESEATIVLDDNNTVRIKQSTQYPFTGSIKLLVSCTKKGNFPLYVRIPDWVEGAQIKVNGRPVEETIQAGTYYTLNHSWDRSTSIEINFPIQLKLLRQSEFAIVPQGTADIYRVKWLALTRGPLVYASRGLINGEDREKNFVVPAKNAESMFKPAPSLAGISGPIYELKAPGVKPLAFLPFYEASDRVPGRWRLTWIENEID
jgi:uncharacterized protein